MEPDHRDGRNHRRDPFGGTLFVSLGRLADGFGPQLLTSLGALVATCTYSAMTTFTTLWQFYVIIVIARVVTANTLSSVVPQTAVVNWFRRYRGRALGLDGNPSRGLCAGLHRPADDGASWLANRVFMVCPYHGISRSDSCGARVAQAARGSGAGSGWHQKRAGGPGFGRSVPGPGGAGVDGQHGDPDTDAVASITGIVIALTVNTGVGFHLVAYSYRCRYRSIRRRRGIEHLCPDRGGGQ